jgi:hypothetical protein
MWYRHVRIPIALIADISFHSPLYDRYDYVLIWLFRLLVFTQIHRQIGNAVPWLLANAIGRMIRTTRIEHKRRQIEKSGELDLDVSDDENDVEQAQEQEQQTGKQGPQEETIQPMEEDEEEDMYWPPINTMDIDG